MAHVEFSLSVAERDALAHQIAGQVVELLARDNRTAQGNRVEKLLLSGAEAAEVLSICPRKLGQLAIDGAIPSVKVGSARLFPVELLRVWIASQAQGVNGDVETDDE